MITREEYETEFYSRTVAYLPGFAHASEPLVIVVGPSAHTPAGHALMVALTNQVARAHRRIIFVGELDQPLLCADVFGAGTLMQATTGLARAINPFINVDVVATVPSSEALLTIGVGAETEIELALGCDGWLALLGPQAPVGTGNGSIWGGLLASCLGANAALQRILGKAELPIGRFSLWDYTRPSEAQGPSATGPLDVGRVLQVGAGAVGSGLAFFLSFFGIAGGWAVVDGDTVDITNLNRQLLFVARDAGFPCGKSVNKAQRVAELLGVTVSYSPAWFNHEETVVEGKYDLVLALANDFGVRSALQARQPTILLHATTSRNWQAQLHRHVAGRDDCIDCRLPPETPRFICGNQDVEMTAGQHFDAAIPPLSATAGLLLAAELAKLQMGTLVEQPHNFTAVDLFSATPCLQRKIRHCRSSCSVRRPPRLRQKIDAHSRWLGLDGEYMSGCAQGVPRS